MGNNKEGDNPGVEAARLLSRVLAAAATNDLEPVEALQEERRLILQRVSSTAEVVTNPESPGLANFVAWLHTQFKPGEVEDLKVFQDELRRNSESNPNAHFICVVMNDPLNKEVVSGAYGSVDKFGTLAVRFTLTEAGYLGEKPHPHVDDEGFKGPRGYRGTGISRVADDLLVEKARELSGDKGISALVGEAVPRSERYWNRIELEPGNAVRRLYIRQADGHEEEFKYRLPPLAWNKDGTPASDEIEEHLQVALRGSPNQINVATLKEIVHHWWETWYIRGKDQFDNEEAWQKHADAVWAVFEDLFKPVAGVENLVPHTRNERESK